MLYMIENRGGLRRKIRTENKEYNAEINKAVAFARKLWRKQGDNLNSSLIWRAMKREFPDLADDAQLMNSIVYSTMPERDTSKRKDR